VYVHWKLIDTSTSLFSYLNYNRLKSFRPTFPLYIYIYVLMLWNIFRCFSTNYDFLLFWVMTSNKKLLLKNNRYKQIKSYKNSMWKLTSCTIIVINIRNKSSVVMMTSNQTSQYLFSLVSRWTSRKKLDRRTDNLFHHFIHNSCRLTAVAPTVVSCSLFWKLNRKQLCNE